MHDLIVRFALQGPVRVLIGGNRFDLYNIAYALAAQAGNAFYHILENHITLSRAEICPQILELLLETETSPVPTLVADLLTPFYDEGFPDAEVDNFFFDSIRELRRMSAQAAVVVSAYPKPHRQRLFHALERTAAQLYAPPPQPQASSSAQRAFA
jgi:hypothetical protein